METINPETPVGRWAGRVTGRTPDEMRMLVNFLRDNPNTWYMYSTHISLAAAHTRASQLRRGHTPLVLLPFMDNIEFKAYRHDTLGPVVLVRWHVAGDTTQVSP